jgi:exodeoxyribonuclease V beta subunit
MSAPAQPLALTLPLTGTRLVEASAGTGKTHTLVLLLLRAIIVEGCAPRELVAVTYTRAAAGELRERTRAGLAAAARRAADPDAEVPPQLAAALDQLIALAVASADPQEGDAGAARARLARRLRAAEIDVDALWLTTVHGFCQRLLAEAGPLLGAPGAADGIDAGDDLFAVACADAWRELQGRDDPGGLVTAQWPTPDALAATLKLILPLPADALLPPPPTPAQAAAAHARYQGAWALARSHAGDFAALAAQIADRKRHGISFNKDSGLSDTALDELALLLPVYFGQPAGRVELPAKAKRLGIACLLALQDKRKREQGVLLPAHPLADAIDALAGAEQAWLGGTRIGLLHALHAQVRERIARRGFELGRSRYDDLVADTAALLAGPNADRLLALARERWRLALIDEFQDTDAGQYAIFAALFGDRLVLVGDPKQAIYRFRGGDVHAYRRAAEAADGQARLAQCYRAEPALLAAVNALFDPERIDTAFRESFIRYQPVDCAYDPDRHGRLVDAGGEPASGLQLWPVPAGDGGSWSNKAGARAAVVAGVGTALARLLDPVAGLRIAGGRQPRALRAGDVAVLCPRNADCAAIAADLRRRGLPVSLGTDPEVDAAAAEDLRRLLSAWLAPHDAGRVRALALSGLHGRTLAQLPVAHTDSALEAPALAAFAAQARLAQDGHLGRALLQATRQGAAAQADRSDGRRRIEAWLRLLDRVASWTGPGIGLHELYLRFRRWQDDPHADGGELPRPPAPADAVAVMTIHASKGLEFGVVVAPFLWDQKDPARRKSEVVRFHDRQGRLCADLGGPDIDRHRLGAGDEELAESMRGAYVAVTRARHRLLLPVAVTQGGWTDSPLAGLLPDVEAKTGLGLDAALARLEAHAPEAIVVATTAAADGGCAAPPPPAPVLLAAAPTRRPPDRFRLLSYSRLVRDLGDPVRDHDQAGAGAPAEVDWALAAEAAAASAWRPRGARFGSCFHALMETVDPVAPDPAQIERTASGFGFGAARERAYLDQLVRHTLAAPLPGGLRLADLAPTARAVELEFFLPLRDFSAGALGRALDRDPRYRREPGRWPDLLSAARGYLRGFIDLVYRDGDGRYHVLDYKTNDLGEDPAGYAPDALAAVIARHDYDLQYLIYLVALQRLLRSRLGAGYDYGRHIGGAVYLFVRGLGTGAGVHHDLPPAALVDALERVFCGAGA